MQVNINVRFHFDGGRWVLLPDEKAISMLESAAPHSLPTFLEVHPSQEVPLPQVTDISFQGDTWTYNLVVGWGTRHTRVSRCSLDVEFDDTASSSSSRAPQGLLFSLWRLFSHYFLCSTPLHDLQYWSQTCG